MLTIPHQILLETKLSLPLLFTDKVFGTIFRCPSPLFLRLMLLWFLA